MTLSRVASRAVLLVCIFGAGYWLSHAGKPLNVLILTVHELVSLAAILFLGLSLYQVHRIASLSTLAISAGVATGVFFLIAIATGGLLSDRKPMPALILTMHRIVPFLIACSTVVTLYLLFPRT
jgi:hypothetical protein